MKWARKRKCQRQALFHPASGAWPGLGLLLAGASCLWSCQRLPSGPSQGPTETEKGPIEPEDPRRIISLSPNVTDILEGVGAFDRVVAVSNYCSYPPGVASLPRVGGWQNASLEEVTSLEPDLVVMAEVQAPSSTAIFGPWGSKPWCGAESVA